MDGARHAARGQAPHGHRMATTFLVTTLRHHRIEASWLFDGPIDGESFRTYVEKVVVPTLRPGDIVIMDNLGSQKRKAARQFIRIAGAKLFFLPKCSPELNPIEQLFAKLMHLLREAAARSCRKLSAQQLPECAPHLPTTNAQIIYKIFGPCVRLIAVMHGDARDQFCVDACQQHAPGKAMRLSVASYLSIAL
jgi:transposase